MRYLLLIPMFLLTACGGGNTPDVPEQRQAQANREEVERPAITAQDRVEARRLFVESEELSVQGDNSRAAEKLERAVQLSPDDPEIHARLGHVYIKLLRYDDARQAFARAIQSLQGEDRRQLEFLASWCCYRLALDARAAGKQDDALQLLEDALQLRPGYVDAQFLRGDIYRDMQEYDRAIAVYSSVEAQTLDEERNRALSRLGETQFHAEKYRDAIKTFTTLISLEAEGYEAFGWRGYCHVMVGEREPAVRDFTQAVQHTTNPERRADYEEKLRQLAQPEDEGE